MRELEEELQDLTQKPLGKMGICCVTQGTQPGVCNNLEDGKGRRREGDSRGVGMCIPMADSH